MTRDGLTIAVLCGVTAVVVGLVLVKAGHDTDKCMARGGTPVPATHFGIACIEKVKPAGWLTQTEGDKP